ncbi:unnamed protein product, partial [Ectocarpus sp. 8 AP-2014]
MRTSPAAGSTHTRGTGRVCEVVRVHGEEERRASLHDGVRCAPGDVVPCRVRNARHSSSPPKLWVSSVFCVFVGPGAVQQGFLFLFFFFLIMFLFFCPLRCTDYLLLLKQRRRLVASISHSHVFLFAGGVTMSWDFCATADLRWFV